MSLKMDIRSNGSKRVRLYCEDYSRTHQSFKDEVDANNIVRKYRKTGVLPVSQAVLDRRPMYGDFSNIMDFQQLQDRLVAIRTDFDKLPSELRRRLDNNPSNLVGYLEDPKNEKEAIELGLLPRRELDTRPRDNDGKPVGPDPKTKPYDEVLTEKDVIKDKTPQVNTDADKVKKD